jgi:hypothetical protein
MPFNSVVSILTGNERFLATELIVEEIVYDQMTSSFLEIRLSLIYSRN